MYQSYIREVSEIDEVLEEINKNKWEIISMVHISDSQQLLIIIKMDEEKKSLLNLFKNTEEEDEED